MTRIRLWAGLAVSALCVYLVARRVNWPSFVAAGIVAIVGVLFMADRLPRLIGRIIGAVAPSFGARVAGFLHGLFTGVRSAAHGDLFAGTLGLSTIVWTFAGIAMLCNVRAFDLQVPWYSAFFVLLVVNLGGVIPASPGSVGLYHYLAMLALTVWITDADRALGFAVVAHATGLGVTTLLGLASLAARHESLFRLTT